MILDISMAKLLQSYGARETTRFRTKESRFAQLLNLVKEAERCVEDLTSCVLSAAASGNLSVALIKEKEKQLTLWKRRQKLLWRMKSGFEKIKSPGPPSSVQLEVVGTRALKVKFTEPETADIPETVVTKYKVEWSVREDFRLLTGSREMMNLQRMEMVISEVTHGIPYYIRVAAGNSKGYSLYKTATPPSAVPSSWMDVDGKKSRSLGRLCQLDCVFHQIIFSRPPCSSEIKDLIFGHSLETPQQQRRQVRKSIKNLFTSTPKFQKTMKRGVYLSCLLYSDHRVLVTTEDTLPIMEVDENCPSCLHNDFHWLMKVACTWEDAKALRIEMEKSHSSSAIHFRSKLLQAAEMMQAALGIQDLGQFFYKPLKDADDTTVLCTVKYICDPKSLTNLSVRWMPLAKLQRKLSINSDTSLEVSTVNSLLLSSTQSMMTYNHVSRVALARGLYVAYVKIGCSVDLIRVLVPKKAPNVLPYYRVRENPHVSCEEWDWIKNRGCVGKSLEPSDAQLKFQKCVSSAARNLLTLLKIPLDQTGSHRIYDMEVVELNPEVSLILLLPPVDTVYSVPGQKDDVTDRDDCVLLPVQIFEMIHMSTYQRTFISRYSRISSILEMDTTVARHIHRQAFSTSELSSAKSRLRQLQDFQTQVDNTWRSMRWLMDVLNFARDKQPQGGILLETILMDQADSPGSSPTPSPHQSPIRHTLQVPCELPGMRSIDKPIEPVTIKITNSTSSFSLTESNTTDQFSLGVPNTEMRRCASTSGLLQAATGQKDEIREQEQTMSRLCLLEDQSKAYSVEGLSVTFKIDPETNNRYGTTTVSEEEEEDVGEFAEDQILNEDTSVTCEEFLEDKLILVESEDTESQDDSVIDVLGSCRNLSSNDPTIPEIDEDDEASIGEDFRVPETPIEENDPQNDNSSEESTDDEGLQFKDIPVCEDEDSKDIDFFSTQQDDASSPPGQSSAEEYSLCNETSTTTPEEGVLRVFAAYNCGLPSDSSVRLHIQPDTSAREIIDTVVNKVNTATVVNETHIPTYTSSQDLEGFCLVALLNSKERSLSDSFQPLKVQNPWTRGKLLVRRKSDAGGSTSEI